MPSVSTIFPQRFRCDFVMLFVTESSFIHGGVSESASRASDPPTTTRATRPARVAHAEGRVSRVAPALRAYAPRRWSDRGDILLYGGEADKDIACRRLTAPRAVCTSGA